MSSLDYIRWAREQRTARSLRRGEGDVLQTLATFAAADGTCHPSVETLAKAVGCSRQHVHKLLRELEHRGLVSTRRRVGRPAVRQLVIDAPHHAQMTLGETPPTDANARSRVAPVRHSNVASSTVAPVASGGDTKEQEGSEEEEEDAREQRPVTAAIATRLLDVLAVLREAPGLLVEDLAVNSVLLAFPETGGHDHLAAARVVHMWACEGGLDCLVANRLLYRELSKQSERRFRADARAARSATTAPAGSAGAGGTKAAQKPWSGALRRAREAAGG